MKATTLAMLLCCALAGCATDGPLVAGDLRVPPESAMRECAPLSPFTGSTEEDLLNQASKWAKEHNVGCAAPHKELIDWVKGNKK